MLRSSIEKNVHFIALILLIALVGTLGVSEFYYSYAESHENKREPVSEPKKVVDNGYSHKIHPQIIKIMNHAQPEYELAKTKLSQLCISNYGAMVLRNISVGS